MKLTRFSWLIFILTIIPAFLSPGFNVLAQDSELSQLCESVEAVDEKCEDLSLTDCRELLEKCQQYLEEKSAQIEKDITKTEQEKKTLQNQVSILTSQIKNLEYQIYQSNLVIKDLGFQIQDTERSIEETSLKIKESNQSLVYVLRRIYEEDQKSVIEVFLKEQKISDFFNDLVALEGLSVKNKELLANIKEMKSYLESQKQALDTEKGDLERVVQIQYGQKQQSQAARKEQEYFLKLTEVQYQQYLKEKEAAEKSAAEIRARLFQLIGIAKAPTFGEALQIAEAVTKVVKIRPAFLLGIISAESALGRNVGQCYITNSQTGSGVYITTGNPINRIIHPTRDLPIFLRLTGDNFSKTPVSCWIPMCSDRAGRLSNNVSIDSAGNIICPAGYFPWGFGGAMGPAQFIPSTWLDYEGKITSLFGISSPNPWNVYDSFAASSLYLYELGAGKRTQATERNAANRYSGGYSWYANDVMKRASCIQDFIDKGTMSSTCQQLIF